MLQSSAILSSGNAVYIMGQGEPLLTICGGPGISSRIYQKYLEPLAVKYQMIFWDYAGTGKSASRSAYSADADYRDLIKLIDQLALKRVNILAHSYGGPLAIRYAVDRPEQLSRLMLVGTASHLSSVYVEGLERKKAKLSAQEFEIYLSAAERLLSGAGNQKQFSDFLRMEIKFQSYRTLSFDEERQFAHDLDFNLPVFLSNEDWLKVDMRSRVKDVQAPTLVMTSEHDAAVPPQYSKSFTEIPNCRFFEFKESGHWPFFDETELFHRKVDDFLSR